MDIHPNARNIIARAWRDEQFRSELPADVRDKIPPAPVGAAELSDDQLEAAAGGTTPGCAAAGIALGGAVVGYGFSEIVD